MPPLMVWKGSMVLASLSIRPCPSTTPKCEAEIIMDQEYTCSVKLEPCCVVLLRVTSWTKIVENGVALGGCKPFLCSSMDHELIYQLLWTHRVIRKEVRAAYKCNTALYMSARCWLQFESTKCCNFLQRSTPNMIFSFTYYLELHNDIPL